jgi:hypothetical protein
LGEALVDPIKARRMLGQGGADLPEVDQDEISGASAIYATKFDVSNLM